MLWRWRSRCPALLARSQSLARSRSSGGSSGRGRYCNGTQGQEHHREHSLRGFQHFLIVCSDVLLLQMCIVQRGAGLVVVAAVVPIILCSRFIYLNIGAALARPTVGADKNCTFFSLFLGQRCIHLKKICAHHQGEVLRFPKLVIWMILSQVMVIPKIQCFEILEDLLLF